MIIDALTLLDDAHAYSGAATTVSTSSYDTGATAGRDLGAGEPLCLAITVDVAADTGNSDETYTFELIQSAAAALTSPDILNQVAVARGTLVAGYKFAIGVPVHLVSKRYLGLQTVLGGTTPSITITALIMPYASFEEFKAYPKGFTIT